MPSAVPVFVRVESEADTGHDGPASRVVRGVRPIDRLGQAPIDDQRLTVRAQHDVGRLQVAVHHPTAVRIVHRVADVEEMPQQLPERQDPFARGAAGDLGLVKLLDGLLEGLALDEPHGVIRAAVGVAAQAVDRDDARVLQPAGDLGLAHEPRPVFRVVGVAWPGSA